MLRFHNGEWNIPVELIKWYGCLRAGYDNKIHICVIKAAFMGPNKRDAK